MVRSRSRSYTFLYLPQVDSLSHEKGPTHTEVVQLTLYIDNELKRLAQTLKDDCRLVITADHGQIAVPMEKRYLLSDGDSILEILDHPPTSEGRFPQFHVSRHRREEFVGTFLERFSESFSLLPLEEAESEGLFGPGEIESNLRPRFGNFVGIAKEDAIPRLPAAGRIGGRNTHRAPRRTVPRGNARAADRRLVRKFQQISGQRRNPACRVSHSLGIAKYETEN